MQWISSSSRNTIFHKNTWLEALKNNKLNDSVLYYQMLLKITKRYKNWYGQRRSFLYFFIFEWHQFFNLVESVDEKAVHQPR